MSFVFYRNDNRQKDETSDPKRLSPFSEMSRRDEGDGRSIADSNYSSYKSSTQFRMYLPRDQTKTTTTRLKTQHVLPVQSSQQRRTKQS